MPRLGSRLLPALACLALLSHGYGQPNVTTGGILPPVGQLDVMRALGQQIESFATLHADETCPDVGADTLERALSEIAFALAYLGELEPPLQRRRDAYRAAWEERVGAAVRQGERLAELRMYTAYQQAFHDLSVLLTRMSSLVSIGESVRTDAMLQDDLVEAMRDGTISAGDAAALAQLDSAIARTADALTRLNGYRSRLLNATNLVVDVGEGTPNALGLALSPGQLIDPDTTFDFAGGELTYRTAITQSEAMLLGGTASVRSLLTHQRLARQMLTGQRPLNPTALARNASQVRAGIAGLALGPLQAYSEHLLDEMRDRLDEMDANLASLDASLAPLFDDTQARHEALLAVRDARAALETAFDAVWEVLVAPQPYGVAVRTPERLVDREGDGATLRDLAARAGQVVERLNDAYAELVAGVEPTVRPWMAIRSDEPLEAEFVDVSYRAPRCSRAWIAVETNLENRGEAPRDRYAFHDHETLEATAGTARIGYPAPPLTEAPTTFTYSVRMYDRDGTELAFARLDVTNEMAVRVRDALALLRRFRDEIGQAAQAMRDRYYIGENAETTLSNAMDEVGVDRDGYARQVIGVHILADALAMARITASDFYDEHARMLRDSHRSIRFSGRVDAEELTRIEHGMEAFWRTEAELQRHFERLTEALALCALATDREHLGRPFDRSACESMRRRARAEIARIGEEARHFSAIERE